MDMAIIPRVERGRLYFQTPDLLVPTFTLATGGWSAAEPHRCPAFVAKGGAR
jgi:hypothetical protein